MGATSAVSLVTVTRFLAAQSRTEGPVEMPGNAYSIYARLHFHYRRSRVLNSSHKKASVIAPAVADNIGSSIVLSELHH